MVSHSREHDITATLTAEGVNNIGRRAGENSSQPSVFFHRFPTDWLRRVACLNTGRRDRQTKVKDLS